MLGHTYRINENECEFLNRSARFTSFLMNLLPVDRGDRQKIWD